MSRSQADLGITAAVAVSTCAAAAVGAPVAIMTVLGIVLFAAPGYLLGQLLLGSHVAGLERLAVITGLVFCVPILGGLLLYAARVPLHRTAWLGLFAGVTLACDLVLFVRHLLRRRSGAAAASNKQFAGVTLACDLVLFVRHLLRRRSGAAAASNKHREQRRPPTWNVAAFSAAVVIAVCAIWLARAEAVNQHYPGFTQLWLVHRDQNARTMSLGVANHEGRTTRYKLVLFHSNRVAAIWNLDLPNGRTWQRATQFTDRYTITAKLYRLPDVSSVYRYASISGNRNGS
jgi:uncharacterized membrane protein